MTQTKSDLDKGLYCGIIEGFFGRPWSHQHRLNYANFLARFGLDFYLYAPKSDTYLRRQWQIDWPSDQKRLLCELRSHYATHGVDFGIGLTPFEIHEWSPSQRRTYLSARLKQINALSPDTLCILFDDMRGDVPNLAAIQTDIVHQAASESTAKRIIFCPTYYTTDPILEKVFGERPADYWSYLAANIDPAIDIFWTGEQVCSEHYSEHHLDRTTQLLGRKPFLWDNYPVNDGAKKSQFIHLREVSPSHASLPGRISGIATNPMNQAALSQIPIASLSIALNRQRPLASPHSLEGLCNAVAGPEIGALLYQDVELLQDIGLQQLTSEQRFALGSHYANLDHPMAVEIMDWLAGGYTFDPACLTE